MESLMQARAGFEALGNQYPVAKNIQIENTIIAGIPCAWLIPATPVDNDVVIFIHGGGFIYGSVKSHAALASHVALVLKRKILLIDYRLAPEHRFPNGLNDCVAVITAFCHEHPNANFGIIGDSAGGNLTMAAQLQLKALNKPLPKYSMLISPWVDLECKNASYTKNKNTDTILNRDYLLHCAHTYAGHHKLSHSLVSPVNADLSGLPPALIMCSNTEILEDDSMHLFQQLLKAGVHAECVVYEGEQHVWPFMDIDRAASQKALNEILAFVTKQYRAL